MDRRDLLKLTGAGIGAAALSSTALGAEAAVAAAPAPRALNAPGDDVDFWASFENIGVDPVTGQGNMIITYGNDGTTEPIGPLDLIAVTPFFVNFDFPGGTPPAGIQYVVNNPAVHIPEMIRITRPVNELAPGSFNTIEVPIKLEPGGPRLVDLASVYALPTADIDRALINNEGLGTVGEKIKPLQDQPPGTNRVNFYTTFTEARLKTGSTVTFPIFVGNRGPDNPDFDAVLTYVSPFRAKVDRSHPGFALRDPTYYHTVTDPNVVDILTVPIPRGHLRKDPNLLIDLLGLDKVIIPLRAYDGAYSNRSGKCFLSVSNQADWDSDIAIAISRVTCKHA